MRVVLYGFEWTSTRNVGVMRRVDVTGDWLSRILRSGYDRSWVAYVEVGR